VYFSIALNILFLIFATIVYLKPTENNSWILFKFSTPWLAIIFLMILLDLNNYSFAKLLLHILYNLTV
ncbi:MAG: protoheme IX farnesyltransferase, partial [Thermoproteota archaeon]